MRQISSAMDRRYFNKIVVAMAATSIAPLAVAQIGGLPEAPNSRTFQSDGTRERLVPYIKDFFGNAKGHYFDLRPERFYNKLTAGEAETVVQQFIRVFNDQPGGIVNLPDGYQITYASKTHDASNVALVVTPSGASNIIAAGVLHSNCGRFNGAPLDSKEFNTGSCENKQIFTIIWGRNVAPSMELNNELKDWMVAILKERAQRAKMVPFDGKLIIQVRRLG